MGGLDFDAYFFRGPRMPFSGGGIVVVPATGDEHQRALLAAQGQTISLSQHTAPVRVEAAFEMRFGQVDARARDTSLLGARFEEVFGRYWAQVYPDRALTPDTALFVLLLGEVPPQRAG